MSDFSLRTLAAVLGVLLAGGGAAAGQLRGRLLVGDRPATGVTVSAVPYEAPLDEARREARRGPPLPPLASTSTGTDGSFVLTVSPAAAAAALFTVRVEGGGAVAATFGGVWSASESEDLGEHVLPPGERLAGKVIDSAGAPVADAEVVLAAHLDPVEEPDLEAAPRTTRTAPDGTFSFGEASARGNTLMVDKPGLLVARATAVRSGTLPKPIAVGGGVAVAGVVRRPDGSSPAAGALVRIEAGAVTRWVESGPDGSFAIAHAPAGTVTVVADGGEAGYVERGGVKLPLSSGEALALVLRPPSALIGRTVDARTGQPVPRARIEVRSAERDRAARSAPDGTYALRGLPPGTWRLRADEPRYVAWTRDGIPVHPGESRRLDIPLVLGATITGRVVDESGKPVANAKGSLARPDTSALARMIRRVRRAQPTAFRTRPDGTFRATRLAPGGNQILGVSHPDFEPATIGSLSLLPGATRSGLTVVMRRGSVLAGTVQDAQGRPIPGAEVELLQMINSPRRGGFALPVPSVPGSGDAEHKTATTGADGKFALHGVEDGEQAIAVRRSGYATERVEAIRVPQAATSAPLTVTLVPGAAISGRVARRTGEGVEGVMVSAAAPQARRFGFLGGTMTDQPTGPDGSFSIDGLEAGAAYDLQLFGPGGPGEGRRGVTAPALDVLVTVAGTGRVTGTALDAQSGRPMSDFAVSYESDRGGAFRFAMRAGARGLGGAPGGPWHPVEVHGDDGAFALEDVPAGTWSVLVTATGYQPSRVGGIVVEEGGTRDGVLVRVAKGTLLKGRVVDGQTGAALPNAAVSIFAGGAAGAIGGSTAGGADGDVTTDADGRFELEGVAFGRQTLHVVHPDYTDAIQTVEVKGESTAVEIQMTQGGTLAGTVVLDTGQPVAGADVRLSQAGGGGAQSSLADGAGAFRFDHLAAGRFTVAASYGSRTSAPLDVVLQAGQSQEGVSLQLQAGVTIQGTVSGLPQELLGRTMVTATGANAYFQTARAGADGRFEFDNVPPGTATLRGTTSDDAGSTRSATRQVTLTSDQPVVTAQLEFEQGLSLSGHVTRAGQPIAGVTVMASLQGGGGFQASSLTDDAGGYRLADLMEGTYTVFAVALLPGAAGARRQTITLTSDQVVDIAFPSARIGGQVVDAGGKMPLANATVTIATQDPAAAGTPWQRPATTDSDGRFAFADLDAGTYTLSTNRSDYQLDRRDVTAADPGTDGLVIELTRGAGIGIRARDGLAGVPLPAVTVRVLDEQGLSVFGPSRIVLDGEGQGEVPSLQPGSYSVLAGASGYAPVRLDGVNVPTAVLPILLTPGGTVALRAGPKTLGARTAAGTITTVTGRPAILTLFNSDGRLAISEPSLDLRNFAPGSYVLTIPAVEISEPFSVTEGSTTVVTLP